MTVRIPLLVAILLAPIAAAAQPQPAQAQPRAVQPPQPRPQVEPARSAPIPQRDVPQPVPAERPTARTLVAESPGQIAARNAGQSVNVKVDVTFHDQTGNDQRRTKTVSVVTADGLTGFVRTIAQYEGNGLGAVPLNIDVEPRIIAGGKIRLILNLQYTLPASNTDRSPGSAVLRSTEIRENLALVLDDGKSMVVAQSADPVGDRRVTVEVVASITK